MSVFQTKYFVTFFEQHALLISVTFDKHFPVAHPGHVFENRSSVCGSWRQIVTSDRVFWLNTSFANFMYPSPYHALACMKVVLERCRRKYNYIELDFRSLKGAGRAEATIESVLDILLDSAPEISSSRWMNLLLSTADEEHIDIISDYFQLTAPRSARAKLSSITTLEVALVDSQSFKNPSTTSYQKHLPTLFPVNKVLPRFNTKHFPNVTKLHLTNVCALIFPSNIYQCPLLSEEIIFELWLIRWTCIIEDTVIFSDQAMPHLHLVTDSYMNFVHSPFCSATALTIHFPKPSIPMSSHEPAISFSKAPSISNIAQFFLKNNFYGLCTLQLNNVTPRIWLAFLSLLKPLPSTLLAGDPLSRPLSVLPWEEISVYFASDLLQSKVVTSSHPDCAPPSCVVTRRRKYQFQIGQHGLSKRRSFFNQRDQGEAWITLWCRSWAVESCELERFAGPDDTLPTGVYFKSP